MVMRIYSRIAVLIGSVIFSMGAVAQNSRDLKEVNKHLKATQQSFSKLLAISPMDKNGKDILNRLILAETDSLKKFIIKDKNLPLSQKLLALNCQCYFLDTLQSQVNNKTLDVNLIRDNHDDFFPLWQTIINQKSCDDIMRPFGPKTAGLMAGVFREYPQSSRIKDIATLKSLETTPGNIMQFLYQHPNFSLRDSLIFMCANTLPELLIHYSLEAKNKELMDAIRNHQAPLVQTLVGLAGEKNLNNYLPFAGLLCEKKITLGEIDQARMQPSSYYQLIVDAELANMSKRSAGIIPLYQVPTRAYLKKYAVMFFTDVINSLHETPRDKDRYYVLDGLRPQDLYFIITSGETELYTSSYLYTYKKLMGMLEKTSSDSLFRLVRYSQYRKFLLMAGRYNTLSSFLQKMPKDSSIGIIKRVMNGLEERSSDGLEQTINIAETFPGIVTDNGLFAITTKEIKSNITRCRIKLNPYGIKVYQILLDILNVVKNEKEDNRTAIPKDLQAYFKIPHLALREKNGNITQEVLFYGDDDGKSSFSSFLTNFSDAEKWSIEKNEFWATIRSRKSYPVVIYANLPLGDDDGRDTHAQDTLNNFLAKEGILPHILIHRGHSYHLPTTINHVTPESKLTILGSCGGYHEIFEIIEKCKDAQIISTKQIGSLQVNEPILKAINERLINEKDLDWSEIWNSLDKQFKPKQIAYDYFQEYVPPYKNISLLVAALYTQQGMQ
jgi:hypothetical protein